MKKKRKVIFFEKKCLRKQPCPLRCPVYDYEMVSVHTRRAMQGALKKAKMRMEYIRINDSPLRVMFARVQSDSFSTFLSANGKIGESPTVAFHQ